MKSYEGVAVWLHLFLTSALDGGEWSDSRPGRFTPRESPPTPRYPLDISLSGTQSQSGHRGNDEKTFPAPARNWTLVVHLVATAPRVSFIYSLISLFSKSN